MVAKLSRRALTSPVWMGLLFVVLVASLYILGTMALRLDQFGRYYYWLLIGNVVALTFIAVLIGINGWRLLREFREQVAGSRLTVKLVILSVLLALMPVTLVYGFSIRFLRANINSYFDLEIEQALDDAIELSRESLGLQMRTLQRDTINVAQELVGVNETVAVIALNSLSAETESSEMTLIGPDNRIIASTGLLENLAVQPNRPDDDLIARARLGLSYVGVDPIGNGDLYIRVVAPVFSENATLENSVLQALYPIAQRSADLAESVESSYQQYRQLVFLRQPLMLSSMLSLSLALLLSVMMAVWFAFYAARRMMMPVHDLVQGTRAVADGDYSRRIYKRGKNDELGFLVQSFNYMTLQLGQSREAALESQQLVENQRAYLEAVLGQISSGVVTLDADNLIRTSNPAAIDILGPELADMQGSPLKQDKHETSIIAQFADQIERFLLGSDVWSAELEVLDQNGRRFLFCRGAPLQDVSGESSGMVVVIDDMTTIIAAQRDAAWSEVARRLAHEIKNPLTPIQLSAERMRRKFMNKLDGDDVDVLSRLTQTIENQVDVMKSMVNAFAEYASAPKLSLTQIDINQLIQEVAELYSGGDEDAQFTLELEVNIAPIAVDLPRMRQLLNNLIKNALEAEHGSAKPQVRIQTRHIVSGTKQELEIVTSDEGVGFDLESLSRVFEPYVTSKPRGTGLGLAIVKKIVEEHDGTIKAGNHPAGGAMVTVLLPYPKVPQLLGNRNE